MGGLVVVRFACLGGRCGLDGSVQQRARGALVVGIVEEVVVVMGVGR